MNRMVIERRPVVRKVRGVSTYQFALGLDLGQVQDTLPSSWWSRSQAASTAMPKLTFVYKLPSSCARVTTLHSQRPDGSTRLR